MNTYSDFMKMKDIHISPEHQVKKMIEDGKRNGVNYNQYMVFGDKNIPAWERYNMSMSISDDYGTEQFNYERDAIRTMIHNLFEEHPYLTYMELVKYTLNKFKRHDACGMEELRITFTYCKGELELIQKKKAHLFI